MFRYVNDWLVPVILFVAMLGLTIAVWEIAHSTVAKECDKLGAFYVGKTVYKCERRQA